tara:strand:+ start:821 stop:1054 length:234 start_codon:yes stop_codon:yes gene_type:complete
MARHRTIEPSTGLTHDALETLLDLVEIRLGSVEIYDREDARELKQLQKTRDQLHTMLGIGTRAATGDAAANAKQAVA